MIHCSSTISNKIEIKTYLSHDIPAKFLLRSCVLLVRNMYTITNGNMHYVENSPRRVGVQRRGGARVLTPLLLSHHTFPFSHMRRYNRVFRPKWRGGGSRRQKRYVRISRISVARIPQPPPAVPPPSGDATKLCTQCLARGRPPAPLSFPSH